MIECTCLRADQSLEFDDTYQIKMLDCDRKLESLIAALVDRGDKPIGKLPRPRVKTKQVNTPSFDVRPLYTVSSASISPRSMG